MSLRLGWADLQLRERLGEGHAGEVWSASLRKNCGRLVAGSMLAVKRYKPWVLQEPGQFERIWNELGAGRAIEHPNVVTSHCVVATAEGLPALVMELCDGPTMEHYLQRHRVSHEPPPVDDAFRFIGSLASGIGAIHKAGFVHRDIKPSNVILTARGPVIMDLGVVSAGLTAERTTTSAFLGTIRYAPPQYLLGDSPGAETDLYALGAISYELLTGKLFYEEEDHWARLVLLKRDDIARWSYGTYVSPKLVQERPVVIEDYQAISLRANTNAAEAARFVLRGTLGARYLPKKETFSGRDSLDRTWFNPRPLPVALRLESIEHGVKQRFWREPFYCPEEDVIEMGELRVAPPGEWKKASRLISASEAADIIYRSLSPSQLGLLIQGLNEWYWVGLIEGYGDLWPDLQKAGLLECFHDDVFERWWRFHPSAIAAYRYGYLRSEP